MSARFATVPWSLQALAAERDGSNPVDGLTIAVYAALQRFTDFGGETGAHVSDSTLARYAGCDTRTVQRRRQVLRRLGFIEWTPLPGRPNRYTVRMSRDGESQSTEGDPRQAVPTVGQRVRGTTDSQSDNQEPSPRASTYPAEFDRCWTAYPERHGGNNKNAAFKRWKATLKRAGVRHQQLTRATQQYSTYCDSEGIAGTRYVKQASTFFGPDEHWRDYLNPQPSGRHDDLNLQEADW